MKKIVLVCGILTLIQAWAVAQPIAPGGLAASTLSPSGMVLTWTDLSTNETGFQIERSLTPGTGFSLVATAAANATSYINTGLASGKPYYYRIRAVNAAGSSGYTPTVAAVTGLRRFLIDFGAPTLQTATTGWNNVTTPTTGTLVNLVESTGAASSVSLQIVKDPSNGYGANSSSGSNVAVLDYPVSAVSDSHYVWQSGGTYRVSGLDNGKVYNIRLFGSRLYVGDSRKDVFTIKGQQQSLETANNTTQTVVFSGIAPVSGAITIDLTVATGSTFGYINVMDIVESSVIPAAPQALTATATSSTTVGLAWTDASVNETGFQIERSSTDGAGFAVLTTTAANATGYSDTELTPNTSYLYRIKAVNAEGSSAYTAEASVTTLVAPPAPPAALVAVAHSSGQIDLTWADASVNELGFQIERSLTTGAGFAPVATTSPNATSFSNTGLTAATSYFYRVKAVNAGGSSAYSAEASATTLATPPVPPAALTATAVSSTQVHVTWADASGNETGFEIERSQTTDSDFILVTTTEANITTYSDVSLAAGSIYFYRVRAINDVGNSAYTAETSVTTLPLPPAAPTNLTVVAESSTQANLTWHDHSDNETAFQLERSLSADANFAIIATLAPDVTTHSDVTLSANTSYVYRVRAINAGGSSAYGAEATTTTPNAPPVAPSTLTVTDASPTQVNVAWTDPSGNVTGFELERSQTSGSGFQSIVTTSGNVTTYSDTDLLAETPYFYRVKAINDVGSSAYTAEVSVVTPPLPPASPTALVATAVSSVQIDLTWHDASTNERGFEIERSLSSGTGFTLITTTAANVTHYSDANLNANTAYYYRARAINMGGHSSYTAEALATTLQAPPIAPATLTATAASATQINLTWPDASGNETGFQIERSPTSQQGFALIQTVAANTTTYADAGITEGTLYYYRVRAINDTGSSAYTPEASATTLSLTQPYGQIFSETAFSSATRFPIKGTGISRGSDKLVMTGNPTLFSSYIYHDDAANPFRYTCLENWKVRTRVKTPATLNSSSYGIGIGVQSVNTVDPYSTTLRWSWDAGQNFIYLYYKSTTSLQMVSTTKYVPAANTYYWVEVTRAKDAFTYTIFDGATGKTQLFTAKLTFPTFTAGNYVKAHNTGQFCLHQFGGTNTEVTNWEVSTTALKNADYIGLGDSNMHGMFASNNSQRWIESAMTSAGKSFNILAGISDRTTDLMKRLPEVIALKPKAVILSIGRNDIANSVSLSTVQSNIDYIINTLQSAGITVNLGGVVASNVNVSALQMYYNGKTNVQVNAYTATKSASGTTLNPSFNSGDNIHLNQAGNTALSKLLLTILVPQAPPAAPSALVATSNSSTQVDLTWSDNSNNETGFQIERSLTSGSGYALIATTAPNTTAYSNTGLAANTSYFYRIRATNASGSSAYTAISNAITQPVTLPAAPTALKAIAASSTQINVSWTDASTNETGFQLERSSTSGSDFTVIATPAKNVVTFADGGLTPGTKYYYRLKAINEAGGSAYTLEATATTTSGSVVHAAGNRRFLIDFGSPDAQTLVTGWNNIISPATGTIVNLVESTGSASVVSFEIVKDPSNGYGAFNTAGSTQTLLDYPVSALSDSHYGWGTGGTYRLSGLDDTKTYSLRIFGSRMSVSDSRKGAFAINGQQQFLEAANNTSQTILFSDIVPVMGTITIDFTVATGATFSYINVMDIGESSSASPSARVMTTPSHPLEETSGGVGVMDAHVEVYPNPASDQVNINIKHPAPQTTVVQIINLLGVEVYRRDTNTNQNNVFDVRSLSSGLYVIRAKVAGKYYHEHFLRQD
jgi:titin